MRPNPHGIAQLQQSIRTLPILDVGSCEPLKATFHGAALGLAAIMGAYNAAAWLRRRQSHLAINAVIYIAAAFWEQRHVSHHLVRCFPAKNDVRPPAPAVQPVVDERQAA